MKCFERKEVSAAKDYVCELTGRIIKKGELHVASKCTHDRKRLPEEHVFEKIFTHRACMDSIKAYSLIKFSKATAEEKEQMQLGQFPWPIALGEYDSLVYSYIQDNNLFEIENKFKDRTELVLADYNYKQAMIKAELKAKKMGTPIPVVEEIADLDSRFIPQGTVTAESLPPEETPKPKKSSANVALTVVLVIAGLFVVFYILRYALGLGA